MQSDNYIIKELGLREGQVIPILKLDDMVEEWVNNDELESYLSQYNYDEVIEWGKYLVYFDKKDKYPYKIYFELVEYKDDDTTIRIL